MRAVPFPKRAADSVHQCMVELRQIVWLCRIVGKHVPIGDEPFDSLVCPECAQRGLELVSRATADLNTIRKQLLAEAGV